MRRIIALICALAMLLAAGAQAEEAYLAAYREALKELYDNQTFPDGETDEYARPEAVEDNGFAVFDVDGDGRRELIVDWTGTITANFRGAIYDYDEATGQLRAEYDGGDSPRIFDNGMLEQPLSHNQGPSELFWPYFLFQYDPEQDAYVSRGSVEAIERRVLEESGNVYGDLEFPESADLDGNGAVYSVDGGEWMDDDAFAQWRASFAGEGNEMRIPYVNLTPKNIQDIQ